MKIVQVNSVCDVGSTGTIASNLAREAIAQGDDVICAYGRKHCSATDINTIRIGNNLDVLGHIILTRLFDMHGLGSKRATRKFLEKIDDFHPDMFHLHNLHGYYINYPMLFEYIKKNNIKVKWTLHDSWAFTGHCAGPECYDCKLYLEGCTECKQKREYPESILFGRSAKNYREKKDAFLGVRDMKIITPSNWLAGLVKQSFLKEYDVEVIHNTIDTEIFRPTKSDFREKYALTEKKIYLCVSFVWIDEKLNDIKKIATHLTDDEVIVLVGMTESDKKKIKGLKILGLGRTESKKQLAEIYTAADVFINPTVKDDNYPTVNLEAQACGTYVVSYNGGGSAETIADGKGDIVPWGDVDLLLKKAREYVGFKEDKIDAGV